MHLQEKNSITLNNTINTENRFVCVVTNFSFFSITHLAFSKSAFLFAFHKNLHHRISLTYALHKNINLYNFGLSKAQLPFSSKGHDNATSKLHWLLFSLINIIYQLDSLQIVNFNVISCIDRTKLLFSSLLYFPHPQSIAPNLISQLSRTSKSILYLREDVPFPVFSLQHLFFSIWSTELISFPETCF